MALFPTCPKCSLPLDNGVGTRVKHRKCCTPEERFWFKVDKSGGPTACWPFKGARVPAGGYGRALLNGKLHAAHRYAWVLTHGEPREGLHVLHRCDNPPCCNPAHLWLGTHDDNMADMKAKGRISKGYREHGHAVLHPDRVRPTRRAA